MESRVSWLLGMGLASMMVGCCCLVMVDEALTIIGRFYGVWYVASSAMALQKEGSIGMLTFSFLIGVVISKR